jgi:quinol monooxygenase YgiN
MRSKHFLLLGTSVIAGSLLWGSQHVSADQVQGRVVRLAELDINAAHLDRYKAALREEIETSIRVEPGVLSLYAVSVKDHPTQIRLFEMYASLAAYQAHLETPHFKKYKTETAGMVKSLTLLDTDPILLGSKLK